MRQSSTSPVKLSNKFDVLQPPEPTAGKPLATPVFNAAFSNADLDVNKKKESDYVAKIQQLESNIQQLTRSSQQWQAKDKQLENDNAALQREYEEFKSSSDQRTDDLQPQISNLQALLAENDGDTRICKKVKPHSRDSNASVVAHSFQPSPSSPQSTVNTQDSSSQSAVKMETSQIKILRPPPIFVHGVTNYTEFIKFLKSQDVDNCLRKETNSALILTTTSAD